MEEWGLCCSPPTGHSQRAKVMMRRVLLSEDGRRDQAVQYEVSERAAEIYILGKYSEAIVLTLLIGLHKF